MKFYITLAVFISFSMLSCKQPDSIPEVTDSTIVEACISNYLTAQNNMSNNAVDTLLTETIIRNMNGIEMVSNINEYKANMLILSTGFPDIAFTYPSQLIKGNQAYIEWSFSGTHTGVFGEINATGKKVKISGMSHLYFDKKGKISREDVFYNELDLLQQLGFSLNPPITE